MGDIEVFVTPGLEARIVGTVVLVAGVFDGFVKVDGIFVEEVGWGEVGAAAKPPGVAVAIRVHGFEVAVVEVHGRAHRILWMQN